MRGSSITPPLFIPAEARFVFSRVVLLTRIARHLFRPFQTHAPLNSFTTRSSSFTNTFGAGVLLNASTTAP